MQRDEVANVRRPMMRILRITVLVSAAAVVAGCATPARIEQMTVAPNVTTAAPQFLRQNIAIKDVTGGQETNPLWTSQVNSIEFERALEASLGAAGMLQPIRTSGRYTLTAQLGKLDQPFIGANMTVTASVLYILVERATSKTILDKTLTTPYTAKFSDSLLGVERLKLANEGAIRENIAALINELATLKIN